MPDLVSRTGLADLAEPGTKPHRHWTCVLRWTGSV